MVLQLVCLCQIAAVCGHTLYITELNIFCIIFTILIEYKEVVVLMCTLGEIVK